MGKTAFLFAGQGSQYPGMGKDFYDNNTDVKEFFDRAEEKRPGTLAMMFSGSEEDLRITSNTQPCLFLADLAAAMVLEKQGIKADLLSGFSLGEVVAMGYSGGLTTIEAFDLVCERGRLMQKASEEHSGSMVAVMKMEAAGLEKLCEEYGVYPVNYNCPGQIVVSGQVDKMEKFKEKLTEVKARFVPLAVGGAFHTPYMAEAAKGLRELLSDKERFAMKAAATGLYSNKTAKLYPADPEEMADLLSQQICNSVRWGTTLENMQAEGVDTFIECGPGKTLSGFVKRTLKDVRILNVNDIASLEEAVKVIREG